MCNDVLQTVQRGGRLQPEDLIEAVMSDATGARMQESRHPSGLPLAARERQG